MHSLKYAPEHGVITAVIPIQSRGSGIRKRERGGRMAEMTTVGSFYQNNPNYEIGVITTDGVVNITIESDRLFALARKAVANKSRKARVGPVTAKFVGTREFHVTPELTNA